MEVSIAEAKNNLSSLIRRVQEGEDVVISKHGRPVARIVRTTPAKPCSAPRGGQIREIDPDWWKPMSDEEAEEFYGER